MVDRPVRWAAMPSTTRNLVLTGALALAGLVALAVRRRDPGPAPLPVEDRGGRTGAPDDRGRRPALGLNVTALRDAQGFEPVVQYLTYIQGKRGDDGHLLFVRYDDLDTLAGREGVPVDAFLERLEQLGVVVSNN